jgi:hypothetical protein
MRVKTTIAAAALALGGLLVTVQPAEAATGCYGGANGTTMTLTSASDTADSPVYTTSSRCSDINMKTTNGTIVRACVIFVNHESGCHNPYTLIGGAWDTVATGVQDGTRFKIRIASYLDGTRRVDAQIAS